MADLIVRLLEPFLRFLFPPRGRRRRSAAPPSRPYVCAVARRRPDERPLRGEDNRLVRPYLIAEANA
ncbi:hypothetical protein ABTX62_13160 [Streptomyces sp. NPDC096046]|uniref:hypothetical protein n=1 Tax=Streptomyces sp. NPDC096046 TaxID=3155542 RepID=UPI0033282944